MVTFVENRPWRCERENLSTWWDVFIAPKTFENKSSSCRIKFSSFRFSQCDPDITRLPALSPDVRRRVKLISVHQRRPNYLQYFTDVSERLRAASAAAQRRTQIQSFRRTDDALKSQSPARALYFRPVSPLGWTFTEMSDAGRFLLSRWCC